MRIKALFLAAAMLVSAPAWAVAKEIIQLQRDVALLGDQLRDLNRLMTERLAETKQLLEQSTDSVNKLNGAIEAVQRSLQVTIAGQGQKVDGLQSQIQSLNDSLEDVKARLARLSEQVAQVRQAQETLRTPPAPAPTAPGTSPQQPPTAAGPPPPEILYQNALRDYMSGRYDLATQEFQDYLKYYPDSELAGNAQFYVGEVFYRGGQFNEAVKAYDAVLQNYPKGNKTAAAHLKKGYALLEMKDRQAGVRELRALIRRFPNSDEARLARDRLKALGLSASARGPTRGRGKSSKFLAKAQRRQ